MMEGHEWRLYLLSPHLLKAGQNSWKSTPKQYCSSTLTGNIWPHAGPPKSLAGTGEYKQGAPVSQQRREGSAWFPSLFPLCCCLPFPFPLFLPLPFFSFSTFCLFSLSAVLSLGTRHPSLSHFSPPSLSYLPHISLPTLFFVPLSALLVYLSNCEQEGWRYPPCPTWEIGKL